MMIIVINKISNVNICCPFYNAQINDEEIKKYSMLKFPIGHETILGNVALIFIETLVAIPFPFMHNPLC